MGMERIDANQIASALLTSAGWARVGLTAPNERLRELAATELALAIVGILDPQPQADPRQLSLNV